VNVIFNVFSINHHLFLLIEDIFLLEVKMSWYFPKTQPIIHLRSYNSHFNYKWENPTEIPIANAPNSVASSTVSCSSGCSITIHLGLLLARSFI
jgi:hypothetical protein